MEKLMKIHPDDNVLVARRRIDVGEWVSVAGVPVRFEYAIGLGHKVAERGIAKGDKVVKFGIPIGSATEAIPQGGHVHLHNLKSDYLPTYTLNDEFIDHK
jgi:hypothetical protein